MSTSPHRVPIDNSSLTSLKLSYLNILGNKPCFSPVLPISVNGIFILPVSQTKNLEVIPHPSLSLTSNSHTVSLYINSIF